MHDGIKVIMYESVMGVVMRIKRNTFAIFILRLTGHIEESTTKMIMTLLLETSACCNENVPHTELHLTILNFFT